VTSRVSRLKPDPFVLSIVLVVVLASLWPARDRLAQGLDVAAAVGIALLFFLHGARLPREAIVQALTHWRLHGLVLATTFVIFPLLGLLLAAIFGGLLSEPLTLGLVFLGCVPSTVQSSIAFTAIAGGNVAASVGAAALSNLVGVVLTPLLVALLVASGEVHGEAGVGTAIRGVALQLLLPFALGQLLRPWLAAWVIRKKALVSIIDRGSILLVVYVAFSAAVVRGLWQAVTGGELALLVLLDALLLAVVIGITTFMSRLAKLPSEDEITVVFCGSKKSLATGVPIAGLLFPEAMAGKVLLPLMMFHQLQLMVMAVIAQRWARRMKAKRSEAEADTDLTTDAKGRSMHEAGAGARLDEDVDR